MGGKLNKKSYFAVGVLILAWCCTGSVAYAQQSTTVGALLDRGGRKLTKAEITQLVSGATIEGAQGGNFPDTTFKNVYAADGSVMGDAWNRGTFFSKIKGKWSVNDAGQLCSDLRNDRQEIIAGCQWYYVVGASYFAARADAKATEANLRKFSR